MFLLFFTQLIPVSVKSEFETQLIKQSVKRHIEYIKKETSIDISESFYKQRIDNIVSYEPFNNNL